MPQYRWDCFFITFLLDGKLIIQWASENVLTEISAKQSKFKNLFSSLEFAPNDYFILVSDGIDKHLRNKKLELRQNIIANSTKSSHVLNNTYNQFHNILRLFNVLPNFPFTTSETMCDYCL